MTWEYLETVTATLLDDASKEKEKSGEQNVPKLTLVSFDFYEH